MPQQFPYPEVGWSTGRMRKRGEKTRFEQTFEDVAPQATGELTPAQQVFERSRPELGEAASGRAKATPSDVAMGAMMLRNPAGTVVSMADFLSDTTIGKKVKDRIASLFQTGASRDEIKEALPSDWRIHEAEVK